MTGARRRAAGALGALLAGPAAASVALAHEGAGHAGHASWLPAALSLAGVALLVASVYLDASGAVDDRFADLGVLLGLVVLLGAVPAYWF